MAEVCLRVGLAISLVTLAGACGAPSPMSGVDCPEPIDGGSSGSALRRALLDAKEGDCVVARGGTFREGGFAVNAGVTLAAEDGAKVVLEGNADDAAVLTVAAGGAAWGVQVSAAPKIGVVVDAPGSTLDLVTVSGAREAGVAVRCVGDCSIDQQPVILQDLTLTDSSTGLWVSGAPVTVVNGQVSDQQGRSLVGGYGIVALGGAMVQLTATVIEANQMAGVLVDGAGGTRVLLTAVQVTNNIGRGIWAQGLTGTPETPGLIVDGGSVLEHNGMAGLGVVASSGVRFEDSRVSATVKVPTLTQDSGVVDIGDGVGLFAGSRAIEIRNSVLERNERTQLLVDQGGDGIHVVDVTVVAEGDEYKVVVQRTSSTVEVPSDLVSEIPVVVHTDSSPMPVPAL